MPYEFDGKTVETPEELFDRWVQAAHELVQEVKKEHPDISPEQLAAEIKRKWLENKKEYIFYLIDAKPAIVFTTKFIYGREEQFTIEL